MAQPKLKPIEERDPYAAMVLDAFDRLAPGQVEQCPHYGAHHATTQFAKDCGCVTHDGPHWIHMDEMARDANRRHLEAMQKALEAGDEMGAWSAAQSFAHCEQRRLAGKLEEMKRRGIEQIPAEVVALVRSSNARWRTANARNRRRQESAARDAAERRLTEAAAEYDLATTESRKSLRADINALQRQLRPYATPTTDAESEHD